VLVPGAFSLPLLNGIMGYDFIKVFIYTIGAFSVPLPVLRLLQ
jgi:hypothetical protein